jgi:hypothetical protein
MWSGVFLRSHTSYYRCLVTLLPRIWFSLSPWAPKSDTPAERVTDPRQWNCKILHIGSENKFNKLGNAHIVSLSVIISKLAPVAEKGERHNELHFSLQVSPETCFTPPPQYTLRIMINMSIRLNVECPVVSRSAVTKTGTYRQNCRHEQRLSSCHKHAHTNTVKLSEPFSQTLFEGRPKPFGLSLLYFYLDTLTDGAGQRCKKDDFPIH